MPLRENLDQLAKKTEEVERSRVNAYSRIDEQVRLLARAATLLDEKTTSLSTALSLASERVPGEEWMRFADFAAAGFDGEKLAAAKADNQAAEDRIAALQTELEATLSEIKKEGGSDALKAYLRNMKLPLFARATRVVQTVSDGLLPVKEVRS